jgi:hypothetical protein
VLRQSGDDLWQRHLRQFRGCDIGAGLNEHFNPPAKSCRIEVLIEPGPRRPPEIEIEEVRQLRRRCLRDELDAILEPVPADDAMQQLGPQLWCQLGEPVNEWVWQVNESNESAREQTDCFRY